MIKLIGIVFISLILIILLRKLDSLFAVFITICSAGIIFLLIVNDFSKIITLVNDIYSKLNEGNNFISIMLKIVGISLIAQFVADLCRDCGESAIATQTETATKIIILITVLPVFESIINLVTGLLK